MAKTYANGVTGADTTTPMAALGNKQGGRSRRYFSNFTMAAQAIADEVVVARPNPGELFTGIVVNTSVTVGATATVQLKQYDVTNTFVRNLTGAVALIATAVDTSIAIPTLHAAYGVKLDGGELRLAIAAAALPGAGDFAAEIATIGY